MLGNITEKQPSKKVAPLVIGNSGGFPPVLRSTITKRLPLKADSDRNSLHYSTDNVGIRAEAVGKSHLASKEMTNLSGAPFNAPKPLPVDESSQMNEDMIQAMSHEEIALALDEIRSILSPKSIEFLQKGPVPTESQESAPPKLSAKHSQTLNLVPEVPLIPTSDNPWNGDSGLSEAPSHSIVAAVSAENPSVDRYDLNGRKVVDLAAATNKIKEEVRKSGLFNSSQGFAEEVGDLVAKLCADCWRPMAKHQSEAETGAGHKYFVWKHDALFSAQNQPQDELKHHQFQSESPGYSLREIMEMFRSEFANQRIVAMRMLSGVLLRRECAVALEAYSQTFSTSEAGANTSRLSCVEDEVGRESVLFAALSSCFEDMVTRVKKIVCTSETGGEIVYVHNSSASFPSLTPAHNLQLRKLLCWSSMHILCAPDLPVELPTLLLWAMSSNINTSSYSRNSAAVADDLSDLQLAPSFGLAAPRNNPAVAKLSLLRCLRMYLCSPAEEASVDWIRTGSVLWSAYGTPRLCTPHTRRSGSSYEQDMTDCFERSSKFLDEDDEEQQDEEEQQAKQRTPDSVAEAFALQCRWSRVSAIVSRSTVVAALTSHAVTAVENLLDFSSKNSSSNSGDVVTALGMSSLQLLALIARQGGDDILPIMSRQFLRSSWRVFVDMCDRDDVVINSALDEIRTRWWVALAELILRDRATAAFMFETHGEWTGAVVLRLMLRKRSFAGASINDSGAETIDGIVARVLQYCLTYNFGFECVTEILMAEQVQVTGLNSSSLGTTHLLCSSLRCLQVLEQAAVSAGAILSAAHRKPVSSSDTASASHVPFDSLKIIDQAVQVSSSILSFIKRNWCELERIVLNPLSLVELRTAVLTLLCAVFARAQDKIINTHPTSDFTSLCRSRMAESIVDSGGLRGRGLIHSALAFNVELLTVEQSKVGGSVTAAVLHLSGQGRDLIRFVASQDLFSMHEVDRCIAAQQAEVTPRSIAWLQSQEYTLALHRHLNTVVEFHFAENSVEDLSASYLRNSGVCCARLEVGSPQTAADELVKGSTAEGILMWHYQRVQQAGRVLQITGAASLLLRTPHHNSTIGSALDSLLAVHLPRLSANSHCGILIGFVRAYVRRLIFSCRAGSIANALDPYSEAESKCGSLVSSIVNKACRGSVDALEVSGISGSVPYSRAGDWMKLHGPVNTAITLKENWAFDVLLGDLSGEQLADWLQVLLSQNIGTAQLDDGTLLAGQMYTMLKLSTSDQAPKWVDGASRDDRDVGVLTEANQRAVDNYRALLMVLVERTGRCSSAFTATFCQAVSKEYFATTGMMASHRHKLRVAKSGSSKYVNLEGVLDLCEKALDAGLNQTIDERLHAVVLIVLSGPLMPWSVRQRVWTQLSSLRILHVLEDRSSLLIMLPYLLPHMNSKAAVPSDLRGPISTESLSLYLEVVIGLTGLRSTADRSWVITAISIIQITQFVFSETNWLRGHTGVCTISRQRAQLLLHILALREQNEDTAWITHAMLSFVALVRVLTQDQHSSWKWEGIIENVTKACSSGNKTSAIQLAFCEDWEVEMADRTFKKLHKLIE